MNFSLQLSSGNRQTEHRGPPAQSPLYCKPFLAFHTLKYHTMKHLIILTVTSLAMLFTKPAKAQEKADSIAIQSILQEEVSSWNRGDAQTYSKHFAENGTFTNIRGLFFTGHQQF